MSAAPDSMPSDGQEELDSVIDMERLGHRPARIFDAVAENRLLRALADTLARDPYARHAGLGIGLAVARRPVELHGGTIEVASAGRDQGTTFTIRVAVTTVTTSTAPPAAARIARAVRHGIAPTAVLQ